MFPISSFSFFLTGSDISPLLLSFSLVTQFPKDVASCFVFFTPCLSDCHLDSHPLLSLFLVVATAVYQDSYGLFYIRLTFFQRWLQLSSWMPPHFLLLSSVLFPQGSCPKCDRQLCRDSVLTFFFFLTYRSFEDYIIFYLLVYREVWVLCSFPYSSCWSVLLAGS